MNPLSREDLFSLEQYAERRQDFRAQVIEHKKNRRVDIGPNLSLYFEDRLTIQYQVQEMLRIERIFEAEGINEELEAKGVDLNVLAENVKAIHTSVDFQSVIEGYKEVHDIPIMEKVEEIRSRGRYLKKVT